MAAAPGGPVLSFGIGFKDPAWDEAPHARAVARHIGTEHHELYVGAEELLGVVEQMSTICDEPMADDSIIPTTLVSRLARERVTVALSGDGGDELFGGYSRYAAVDGWLARAARLPGPGRRLMAPLAERMADGAERAGQTRLGRRLRLVASILRDGDADAVHRMVVSQTLTPDALLATPLRAPHPLEDEAVLLGRSTPVDRMSFMDLAGYLTDDILAKVDRASMSTSLEVRCPLLDYRVVEMAWRFPPEAKFADGVGKLPLRRLLARHVPRELTDRPKQGFGAPVELWLKNELRDWAEALMSPAALGGHGLLNVAACRKLWTDFAERGHGFNRVLWNVLVFQAWHATLAVPPRAISWVEVPLRGPLHGPLGTPPRARADGVPAGAHSAPM
jgi:asparagine synthase (glutamine-hydrolysing)